jgi:hypothetical protein
MGEGGWGEGRIKRGREGKLRKGREGKKMGFG